MERVEGIEPSPPAWKAGALPLSYTRAPEPSGPGPGAHRQTHTHRQSYGLPGLVGGAGFEPAKAEPPDLQSGPFDRFGIRPTL